MRMLLYATYFDVDFIIQQSEIKLKEADLKTSSNAFVEKEKELINKIEELDGKLESSARSCENEVEKVIRKLRFITLLRV